MALPPLMSDVVFVGDLSGDQMGESTWWVGLLSWVFIYVERKHHFKGEDVWSRESARED
jgi:hypothetical protein